MADTLWTIERNGIALPFETVEKDKGKNKGATYPAFVPRTEEDWVNLFGFLGQDWIRASVLAKVRTFCANLAGEFTDENTGLFDEEGFKKGVAELSARGETIKEIVARLVDFQARMEEAADKQDMELFVRCANEYKMLAEAYRKKKRTKEDEADVAAAAAAGVA